MEVTTKIPLYTHSPGGCSVESKGFVKEMCDWEEHHGVGEEEGHPKTDLNNGSKVHCAVTMWQVEGDDVHGVLGGGRYREGGQVRRLLRYNHHSHEHWVCYGVSTGY